MRIVASNSVAIQRGIGEIGVMWTVRLNTVRSYSVNPFSYGSPARQWNTIILSSIIELLSKNLQQLKIMKKTTNLVGKFTQSVRRIVQDVKDEGASSGQTKEEVIETNERLRAVRIRLDENYDTAKKALITLMARYSESKSQRNVFTRYALLKAMIKDVIRLETQYWSLVEIPKQEKAETVPAFVLRACAIMERTQKSGEGVKTSAKLAEEAADKRERLERLNDMTTSQIEAENTQMTNDLYRLLKKYTGLRNLIRELKKDYVSSKVYPMVPRYTMLKDMIKDIMHDPDYMEVCHEVDP
ncbi:unnamed protein product [Leptosia nina]|uniref:Uncharacterized protein n=1 Tax=Leptosia nina TaxID=320188 RepID=A0AAV1J9W5_9NEOP